MFIHPTLFLPLVCVAIGCVAWGAMLLVQYREERRLVAVLRALSKPVTRVERLAKPKKPSLLYRIMEWVGRAVRHSIFFSERDVLDIERTLVAAGKNPRRAATAFMGAKASMLVLFPAGALFYCLIGKIPLGEALTIIFTAAAVGIFLPNIVLGILRRPFVKALRHGLPDALDLLVVCVESGLGLESAIYRVAQEIEPWNRPTALEFVTLHQELKFLSDRSEAFLRLGTRTGIDGYRRLGMTLAQTLRYGTSLGTALRLLATELRNERMTQLEEKAARLPALLVGPLILLIMPALMIVLVAPALFELGSIMGPGR